MQESYKASYKVSTYCGNSVVTVIWTLL